MSSSVINFGTVPVNSVSGATLVTLTNLAPSAAAVTISAVSTSGSFEVASSTTSSGCADSLAYAASCSVWVQFCADGDGDEQWRAEHRYFKWHSLGFPHRHRHSRPGNRHLAARSNFFQSAGWGWPVTNGNRAKYGGPGCVDWYADDGSDELYRWFSVRRAGPRCPLFASGELRARSVSRNRRVVGSGDKSRFGWYGCNAGYWEYSFLGTLPRRIKGSRSLLAPSYSARLRRRRWDLSAR